MKLIAMSFIVAVGFAACKSAGTGSQVQTSGSGAVIIPDSPGTGNSLSGYSLQVEGDNVVARRCDSADNKAMDTNDDGKADTAQCAVVAQKSIAAFKTAFASAYQATYGAAMTAYQSDILNQTLDYASGKATRGKAGADAENNFAANYGKFAAVTGAALGINKPEAGKVGAQAEGFALQSGEIFVDRDVIIPYGVNVNSPLFGPIRGSADQIEVRVSGANCEHVQPIMAFIGDNPNVGNLRAAGNGWFRSNYAGRRLNFSYFMVQVTQARYSSVSCRIQAFAHFDGQGGGDDDGLDSPCRQDIALRCGRGQIDSCELNPNARTRECVRDPNGGEDDISRACARELALICGQGQVDSCVLDPRSERRICVDRPGGGDDDNGGGNGRDCRPSFNQWTLLQPSYNFHGGSQVFTYSAQGHCVREVKVDWPGCNSAWVEDIDATGPWGERAPDLASGSVNGNGQGVYRVNNGGSGRVDQINVHMRDTRNFRFVGCQVDVLVR